MRRVGKLLLLTEKLLSMITKDVQVLNKKRCIENVGWGKPVAKLIDAGKIGKRESVLAATELPTLVCKFIDLINYFVHDIKQLPYNYCPENVNDVTFKYFAPQQKH